MQQRSLVTVERITSAARSLFAVQGYSRTSVDAICHAACSSKGAFYHHFSSKDELFLHLLDQWISQIEDQINLSFINVLNIEEGFNNASSSLTSIFSGMDKNLPILLEFWLHALHNPELWQRVIKPFEQFHNLFHKMIENGINSGEIKEAACDDMAGAVLAFSFGLAASSILDPEKDWSSISSFGFSSFLSTSKRRRI